MTLKQTHETKSHKTCVSKGNGNKMPYRPDLNLSSHESTPP